MKIVYANAIIGLVISFFLRGTEGEIDSSTAIIFHSTLAQKTPEGSY
jgi:hypothetical protein